MMSAAAVDHKELARLSFRAIEDFGSIDLASLIHPEYRNWEASGADAELRGPAAFAITVANLNRSFSELRFGVLALVSEGDLVAARTVMHGVHSGPMRSLEATGEAFSQSQSHWYRVAEGRLVEHWANRDDLGFLHQVGAAPAARVGGGA
jgi:predicted ester cyclase